MAEANRSMFVEAIGAGIIGGSLGVVILSLMPFHGAFQDMGNDVPVGVRFFSSLIEFLARNRWIGFVGFALVIVAALVAGRAHRKGRSAINLRRVIAVAVCTFGFVMALGAFAVFGPALSAQDVIK